VPIRQWGLHYLPRGEEHGPRHVKAAQELGFVKVAAMGMQVSKGITVLINSPHR
jgi:hypothetical protein